MISMEKIPGLIKIENPTGVTIPTNGEIIIKKCNSVT